MSAPRTGLALFCALALGGCLLPSYRQNPPIDAGKSATGKSDAGTAASDAARPKGPACGLSAKLPPACDACVRENCCDLANACGEGTECGKDLLEPITPVADFSTDFDPLLGCMQGMCEQACQVNWGCVDKYRWPTPAQDLNVDVTVIDFAAVPDKPLADVKVQACNAVDPSCGTGLVAEATTGKDGKVTLQVQPSFDGFFDFSGGGYLDSTVQWSEPFYRLTGFKQYQLTSDALAGLAVIVGLHQSADEPFNADAGHLIFRVEGCLPLRYLNADQLPRAEVADVKVSFEPNDGASPI
ncbi:MAG: hypothetical protein ACHQ53_17665, partial [Polyangiales bacterium]